MIVDLAISTSCTFQYHLQANHQPVTLQQSTEIAPQPGHSTEVAPQSEHPEDEEEPWAYYQLESSPILETDDHWSPLNQQHPTLRNGSYGWTANKPSLPNWRTLEVDQFGVPDSGKEFNPRLLPVSAQGGL